MVNLQIWLPGFDSKIKVFDNASPEEAQGGRGSGTELRFVETVTTGGRVKFVPGV